MGLYKDINDYALRIKSAAKWNGSNEAVTHVYKNHKDFNVESNYVYEFYVLVRILESLTSSYKLEYIPDKRNKHQFPKAAGNKENYPFFVAYNLKDAKTIIFQICAGTKIINKYENDIYPDISFQNANADMCLTERDIMFIIDAKHKKRKRDRVTTDDVKVFVNDVASLNIDISLIIVQFDAPLNEIDKCAIITNGQKHLDNDKMLADYKCMVMYDFYPGEAIKILE